MSNLKTLDALLSKHAPSDEVRHLRTEVTRLEGLLERRRESSGQISEAMTAVLEAVASEKPPKMKPFGSDLPKAGRPKVGSPVAQVAHVTDWHVGEVVKPEHIEEFGQANYECACRRVRQFGQQLVTKAELTRHAYQIDELHVIGTADWISGDIHDELVRTNEFPAPVAAVKAGFLLGEFLTRLSPHYARVVVNIITAGNHDRLTRKSQCADGGLNSWGYVVCHIAKQFVAQYPNIEVRIHTALSAIVDVANTKYLISHGDGIKGTWGIPYYGVERKKMKEATARMNMDPSKHFDKIVIGHFHSALNHSDWMIGGSLSGTTEFDHKEGRHAKPHQTAWFVHPKHGEFDYCRWFLD
jgi:hypothetical protein